MEFNDLLKARGVEAEDVIMIRHSPVEPQLKKVLPWLASDKPDIYNAYQQTQTIQVEAAFMRASHVASFISQPGSRALFVGLYKRGDWRTLQLDQYWSVPALSELRQYGLPGLNENRPECLWFDLVKTDFYAEWMGRLVIMWPPPPIKWWRWANKKSFAIDAIHSTNILSPTMPEWHQLVLGWSELKAIPQAWRTKLAEWRGIYLILDESDGKSYVGSASGQENIHGRWSNYADTGHGGNVQLRDRKPANFRFTILQRLDPDLDVAEVIRIEESWKRRLHTRDFGLN